MDGVLSVWMEQHAGTFHLEHEQHTQETKSENEQAQTPETSKEASSQEQEIKKHVMDGFGDGECL